MATTIVPNYGAECLRRQGDAGWTMTVNNQVYCTGLATQEVMEASKAMRALGVEVALSFDVERAGMDAEGWILF